MIKFFRNLLLIVLFVSCVQNTSAQGRMTIGADSYNMWILSNATCYGCGSFFAMIVNNPNPQNGYYYYDIYFWSNSYYANGYAANTYIKPIDVYALNVNGKNLKVLNVPYVVVPPKSNVFNGYFYVGYVYSTNPMQDIKIVWSNISAW